MLPLLPLMSKTQPLPEQLPEWSGVLSTKPATISFKNMDESTHLVNLNYKKNKNIFVSNSNLNTNNNQNGYSSIATFFNNPIISDSISEVNKSSYETSYLSLSESLGYLYQPNDVTKVTFSMGVYYAKDHSTSHSESIQTNQITNHIINSVFNNSSSEWGEPSGSMGVNYWHQIDTNEQYMEANLFYSLFGGNSRSRTIQQIDFLSSEFIDSLSYLDKFIQNEYPQNLFFDFFITNL